MQVHIENLSKVYGNGVQALRGVSLEIDAGMFGLLGPNGAGKSTLMRILATLEVPTAGVVFVNGLDLMQHRREIRASLGYLPQFFGAYPNITGFELLGYIARLNSLPASAARQAALDLLENVGLSQARDRKIKTYSGGMLRRLGIAQALLCDPRLLIVDEPTVGLDPEERIRFRNLLTQISRNKIIILSTHIVADISSTCEDLALLSNGRLVFHGTPAELVRRAEGKVWQVNCDEADFNTISSRTQVISTLLLQRQLQLRVVGEPVSGYNFIPQRPNLEDAYIYFMESMAGKRLENELAAAS